MRDDVPIHLGGRAFDLLVALTPLRWHSGVEF
jgi:hypothetical protein